MNKNDLKLDNQVCFPLYLVAKELVVKYGELLKPLGLTYTQYLVMIVLWETEKIDMRALGKRLFLDSSTLTPVTNRLIEKNYLIKEKSKQDKRIAILKITKNGKKLKEKAKDIPYEIYKCSGLTLEEAMELKSLVMTVVKNISLK